MLKVGNLSSYLSYFFNLAQLLSYKVGLMIGYLSGIKKKLKGCPVSIRGSKKYVGFDLLASQDKVSHG